MTDTSPDVRDALVIGAGFAGLYMLHKLREQGLDARGFEAGSDVGGTWYWNRYPGARCDVESMIYSYSFSTELEQDWAWTERYPTQPEILRYIQHVADRFDLRCLISFDTRVESASYDQDRDVWVVQTQRGERVEARYLVTAVGCLSAARIPDLPGLEDFTGQMFHTGQWPHEGVDFAGQRVGVIGTGSSGIQAIPVIAEQADQLKVFQRTPTFTAPAHNRPLEAAEIAAIKADYPALRESLRWTPGGSHTNTLDRGVLELEQSEQVAELERRWDVGGAGFIAAFPDTMVNDDANEVVASFVRGKIESIVHDPAIAAKLSPRNYPIGAKRLCVDTDYYATYNRENVELVDLAEGPLERVVAEGIVAGGQLHELDSIVLATGYDAMTGSLLRLGITGIEGQPLADAWAAGPRTFLGVATAGFPNLFMVTGPGSPSVLTNMVVAIEQHVEWISDFIGHLTQRDIARAEVDVEAQDAWVDHVNELANYTLYPKAASWYLGANVPGKARVFMPYVGGVAEFRGRCNAVAASGYEGFELRAAVDVPR